MLEMPWKETSDSDGGAVRSQDDVTGEILEQALFEVPARPSIPQEVSQNPVARSASAVVSPRHPDRRMLPQRSSKTDGSQPGLHSIAIMGRPRQVKAIYLKRHRH